MSSSSKQLQISMKKYVRSVKGTSTFLLLLTVGLLVAGCSGISQNTHAYLGTPIYPPTHPESVQILQSEPSRQKVRLGEIILGVDGQPAREEIEKRIREGASKLGADAAFIVYDRTHIYPVVYADYWWGPTWVTQDARRNIVAVAIKYQ
jgi:hypothetical protein